MLPNEVVIVADSDQPDPRGRRPGQDGADRLAATLAAYVPAVRMIVPPQPHKDARTWQNAGATTADVEARIDAAPIRRLKVITSNKGR